MVIMCYSPGKFTCIVTRQDYLRLHLRQASFSYEGYFRREMPIFHMIGILTITNLLKYEISNFIRLCKYCRLSFMDN